MQTQTVAVTVTKNNAVKHSAVYTMLQRKALNAKHIKQYTAQQVAQAQAIALALQAVYFKQRVYVNYNANSISVTLRNASAIQAVQYIAQQHNATIKQTQNNVLLHIAQH